MFRTIFSSRVGRQIGSLHAHFLPLTDTKQNPHNHHKQRVSVDDHYGSFLRQIGGGRHKPEVFTTLRVCHVVGVAFLPLSFTTSMVRLSPINSVRGTVVIETGQVVI